ncbi:MAG TPA: nucleotide disphospho-sugar-binding domain-containing protein [Pseudonocardiaceae bacterium]|nr:nucleotide disphospho-sugar-binding domain-containing protein [Pseudonocardiaceae bacterium]
MTRILFTTNAMSGHVRPTVPMVRELVAAGHDVVWYTGSDFESVVHTAGAKFVPIRAKLDTGDLGRHGSRRAGFRGLSALVLAHFLRPIPAYVEDLDPLFDQFDPEVVVADHSFRAGLFLAERRGVPRVAFSVGPLNLSSVDTAPFGLGKQPPANVAQRLRNRIQYWLMEHVYCREAQQVAARIRADMGLRPLRGFFIDWAAQVADHYLQTGIPHLEYPRRDLPASVVFVGPLLPAGADEWTPPTWWPELAEARAAGRPVVFVTQGTVATDPANLLLPTITALAGMDVLQIVTTSGRSVADVLGGADVPANLRTADFIPYTEILPLADLMVTNGGYGGVQLAVTYGVPLVVSGTTEDKQEVNARVAWSGLGVSLHTDAPTSAEVAAAVRRVLTGPGYRATAATMRAAGADYPGVAKAVDAILAAII